MGPLLPSITAPWPGPRGGRGFHRSPGRRANPTRPQPEEVKGQPPTSPAVSSAPEPKSADGLIWFSALISAA